mgnify:CR=1 FL=1
MDEIPRVAYRNECAVGSAALPEAFARHVKLLDGIDQAIGGANHKIEGFFDVCQERGLTGEDSVHLADWPDRTALPDEPELVAEGPAAALTGHGRNLEVRSR